MNRALKKLEKARNRMFTRKYMDAWNEGARYLRERAALVCEGKAEKQFGKGARERANNHRACAAAIRAIGIFGDDIAQRKPSGK